MSYYMVSTACGNIESLIGFTTSFEVVRWFRKYMNGTSVCVREIPSSSRDDMMAYIKKEWLNPVSLDQIELDMCYDVLHARCAPLYKASYANDEYMEDWIYDNISGEIIDVYGNLLRLLNFIRMGDTKDIYMKIIPILQKIYKEVKSSNISSIDGKSCLIRMIYEESEGMCYYDNY